MAKSGDKSQESAIPSASAWLTQRLTRAEQLVLAQQGFVSYGALPSGRRVAKLRFRSHGQQRVLYVGTDMVLAAQIETELRRRQRPSRLRGELKRLRRRAVRLFIEARRDLAPLVAEEGWHYHGFKLRRRRIAPRQGS